MKRKGTTDDRRTTGGTIRRFAPLVRRSVGRTPLCQHETTGPGFITDEHVLPGNPVLFHDAPEDTFHIRRRSGYLPVKQRSFPPTGMCNGHRI